MALPQRVDLKHGQHFAVEVRIHLYFFHASIFQVEVKARPIATFEWRLNNRHIFDCQSVHMRDLGANRCEAVFHQPVSGQISVIATNEAGQAVTTTLVVVSR